METNIVGKSSSKILALDFDYTLVKPKSKLKFPKVWNDIMLLNPDIPSILKKYHNNGYRLVIFTNQGGTIKRHGIDFIIKRLEWFTKQLDFDISWVISTQYDIYRKPFPDSFNLFIKDFNNNLLDKTKSIYCGDACGRKTDFSNSDLLFALNIGIQFMTPEELFFNKTDEDTEEECILDYIDWKKYNKTADKTIPKIKTRVVMLMGAPGSGKSTLAEKLSGEIISKDIQGTTSKSIKFMKSILEDTNKMIIIDNTHSSLKSREEYLKHLKDYDTTLIWVDTPIKVAEHLNLYRFHMGIKEKIPKIAFRTYSKYFQKPNKEKEGFHEIITWKPFLTKKETKYYYDLKNF